MAPGMGPDTQTEVRVTLVMAKPPTNKCCSDWSTADTTRADGWFICRFLKCLHILIAPIVHHCESGLLSELWVHRLQKSSLSNNHVG